MSTQIIYPSTCHTCKGEGYINGTHTKCNICNGWGDLAVRQQVENRNCADKEVIYRLEIKHELRRLGVNYNKDAPTQELEDLLIKQ